MIIEIYMFLFIVSIAFVWLGYQYDSEVLRMVGFLIILIIGVLILQDNIDYVSGSDIVEINSTLTTVTKNYTVYSNSSLGFMLSIIGAIGFVLTFFELRNSFKAGG